MSDAQLPCQMYWRLPDLMAKRNQMSHVEMARALEADGAHVISRTQVGRLVARPPTNLSFALIGALCRILECSPNELFGWIPAPAKTDLNPVLTKIAEQGREQVGTERVPAPPTLPAGTRRLDELTRARVVGPAARALPAHALAKKPK